MKILESCRSILKERGTIDILTQLLAKPNATRKPRMADGVMKVLAYVLSEGLLEKGYVENLETTKLAKELNVDPTTIRKFLKTFGFSYNKDRVTKQEDQSKSLGYIERYFKTEFIDNKCSKTRTSKSEYTIVATRKLYDRLEELNIEDYTRIPDEQLNHIHQMFLHNTYTKRTTIEHVNTVKVVEETTDHNGNITDHREYLTELSSDSIVLSANTKKDNTISFYDRLAARKPLEFTGEKQQKLDKNDEILDKTNQKLDKNDQIYTKIDKNKENTKQKSIGTKLKRVGSYR